MTAPILTEGDINSGQWQRIKAYLESELVKMRAKNDTPLDPVKTAFLRGHIECIKRVLQLGTPDQPLKTDDHLFKD